MMKRRIVTPQKSSIAVPRFAIWWVLRKTNKLGEAYNARGQDFNTLAAPARQL